MGDINKAVSSVTSIYSGGSVVWSEAGSTTYTAMTGIAAEGFDYAMVEISYTSENTTDDLNVHVFSSGSGASSAVEGSGTSYIPIYGQGLTPTPAAGSGVSKIASIMIPDIPYAFLGLVPEPSSTSHQVSVDIYTVRWNT